MRHWMEGTETGTRKLNPRLIVGVGVCCVLVIIGVWVVIAEKSKAAAEEVRQQAVKEMLQQAARAQLSLSAEQAMKADCWHYGGHGSGSSIRAFNAQLPAALTALLSKPETKELSLEQIERVFMAATGQYVTLFEGDSNVLVAAIRPLYCAAGSHDSSGVIAYVVDRSGSYWEIGTPRQILAAQWIEDHWIATADVASTTYCPPTIAELWVVSQQGGKWLLTDKLLRLDWPETMTVSYEDGYHTLLVRITKPYGDPPCEAITRKPGYSSTTYQETQTYHWEEDHYEQIGATEPRVSFVVFHPRGQSLDFLGVAVTPLCQPGATPYAYQVEDWQPFCR
ncbi:MAG: hypothetical protein JXB07_07390 [Anaerolineae bacterium]|nr:hypothetical protein [Anaerolineae bacterium]